jgi:hypothetical protein
MKLETVGNLYTYQDIAAIFQVCTRTVSKWLKDRPLFRLGNTIRVPESEVEKLLQEHLCQHPAPGLVQRWMRVKRTRRPSILVSNDTGTP